MAKKKLTPALAALANPDELIMDDEGLSEEVGLLAADGEEETEHPAQPREKEKQSGPATEQPAQEQPTQQAATEEEWRTERERIVQENQALREWRARFDERQRIIQEAQQQQTQEDKQLEAQRRREAERPDPNIDPVGAELYDVKEQLRLQNERWDQLTQGQQQNQQQAAAQTRIQQGFNYLNQDIVVQSRAIPDLADGLEHLRQWRLKSYLDAGFDPQTANMRVAGEVLELTENVARRGGSPAQYFYQRARELGWQGQSSSTQPAMAPQQQRPPQQQRVEQLQRGQQLQGIGGRQAGVQTNRGLSYEDLVNLPEDQFATLYANPRYKAQIDRMFSAAESDETMQ